MGFFDQRDLELGEDWDAAIVDALQTCKTFIAMASPACFRSEYCGKEWRLFSDRLTALGAPRPPLLKPLIWSIKGAAGTARSAMALRQRMALDGLARAESGRALSGTVDAMSRPYRVFPVAMRVDSGESDRGGAREVGSCASAVPSEMGGRCRHRRLPGRRGSRVFWVEVSGVLS